MRLKENKRDFDDSILKRESAFFNAYKAIGKRLETKRLTRARRLDNMGRLCKMRILAAGVAQLVERNLAKVEVASSRLVSRSKIWRLKRMDGWRDSKVVMQRIANPSTAVRFRFAPPDFSRR